LRFQVGDLVKVSRGGNNLGIIVDVNKANSSSLMSSRHSASLVQNSPDIYYVYFSNDLQVCGPFYTSELTAWN